MDESPDSAVIAEETPSGSEFIALANGQVTPKKPPMDQELGVPTSMPFSSFRDWVSGEMLAPNTNLVSIDRLIEMRRKDGTARALLRLLTLPIMRSLNEAEWIEPEEGGAEETDFANAMFTLPPGMGGMSVSITRFMRETLLAILEGFSVFEHVRTMPTIGPNKGKIVLRKLAHRDSRTIEFLVDDHGGFNGVKQTANVNGDLKQVVLKKDDVWYYAVNEEENPFYGVSMFEAAWHHWDVKRKLYYISHIAAQMAATMGRVGVIPPSATPEEIESFKTALANFGFNTSMVHRTGWEVAFQTQNTGFSYLDLINHQNQQMAKSVVAKFLEDAERQVLIENGGQDAAADFFVMTIESIMTEIAQSLTRYVMPQYIDWNFGSSKYPEYRFGMVTDATRDVIKDLFTVVATAQTTKWTDEFIRELEVKLTERLGLEVDYEEVDKREKAEAEEQARMQEEYFASRAQPGQPGQPPAPPGGPPKEVAAAAIGGGINMATVLREVERLVLARRESDLDAGT